MGYMTEGRYGIFNNQTNLLSKSYRYITAKQTLIVAPKAFLHDI